MKLDIPNPDFCNGCKNLKTTNEFLSRAYCSLYNHYFGSIIILMSKIPRLEKCKLRNEVNLTKQSGGAINGYDFAEES
jgi:hypothetical protein